MPLVSQAQARWAYANQHKPGQEGDAAREFIAASPGGPGSVKALPARVHDGKPVRQRKRRPFGSLAPGED